jgi:peptidoglycan/LPS O-acetylase OafA/YrhL
VRRVGKIYPAFLLAILAHLLFVVTPWNEHLVWFLKAYVLKLSGLTAFIPNMQFSLSGPWWFFSFIVQFYAVFPLLNLLADRHGTKALVAAGALGLAITTVGNRYLVPHGLDLYVTVPGHLPVLCLGMYFARAESLTIGRRAAFAAGGVFLLALWFYPAWLLAPLSVTILLLLALPRFAALLHRLPPAFRFVRYCGAISLPLFAIHGVMRQPFTQLANAQAAWYTTLLVSAAFVASALAAAHAMSWIEATGRRGIALLRAARS